MTTNYQAIAKQADYDRAGWDLVMEGAQCYESVEQFRAAWRWHRDQLITVQGAQTMGNGLVGVQTATRLQEDAERHAVAMVVLEQEVKRYFPEEVNA